MSLTVVTGRANSGKTGIAYDRVVEAASEGRAAILAVPSVPDVQRAAQELSERQPVGLRAVTLDAWIEECWRLFGDGRRVATDAARSMLCTRAATHTPLTLIAEEARGRGLVKLISDVVRRHGTEMPKRPTGIEAEVVAIVRAYRSELDARGLVELRDAVSCLQGRLAGDLPAVVVHRFTDFSPAQELFILELSKVTDALVTLSWQPGHQATVALDTLASRLLEAADEHLELPDAPGQAELVAVADGLYRGRRPVLDPGGAIELALATGPEAEVTLAARVAAQLKREGFAGDRIAVAFKDVERRLPALKTAFMSEGVSADFDVPVRFASTAYGAALHSLLDALLTEEGSRERLAAFLASPYSGVDREALAREDARWRENRLVGTALLAGARLLSVVAREAIDCAAGVLREGGGRARLMSWNNLASLMLQQSLLSEERDDALKELDARSHRAALRVAGELGAIDANGVTSGDLIAAAREAVVSAGAAETDGCVQVTSAHRLRSRRFDAVILGGLTASEFTADSGESLADEIAQRVGLPIGPDRRLSERLLFYLVVSSARERLVLLRQAGDSNDRFIRPSVFWDEVLDLYRPSGGDEEALLAGLTVHRLGLTDIADYAPAFERGRPQRRKNVSAGHPGRGLGHRALFDDEVLSDLAKPREYSVTELETYAQCPYKWFLGHAVGSRELDRGLDARERGSRAHRILSRFYDTWREQHEPGRVTTENLAAALGVLDEIAALAEREARVRAIGIAEELEAATAHRWARRIVTEDAEFLPGFEPVAHELSFGGPEEKSVSLGDLRLKGRIDRVDADGEHLIVSDYKASEVHGHGSFGTYGLLQVPIYAAAAGQVLGLEEVGGVYRSLRSMAARGFWNGDVLPKCVGLSGRDAVGGEDVAEIITRAIATACVAAEGIQEGRITPDPANREACLYCAVLQTCERAAR